MEQPKSIAFATERGAGAAVQELLRAHPGLQALLPEAACFNKHCHQAHWNSLRVSPLQQSEELELQYKSCYARILDSKRRFLEAATRYYELSQVGGRSAGGQQARPAHRCRFR